MPGYLCLLVFAAWLSTAAIVPGMQSDPNADRVTVDVFTTSTRPVAIPSKNSRYSDRLSIAMHEIDHIARFTAELSLDLGADPNLAKQQVLRRFKSLNQSHQRALQESAEALALALQLGVKRYPAIVLNSHWVVYGVPDVQQAVDLVDLWQRTAKP